MGLLITALFVTLARFSWGTKALAWAWHPSIEEHASAWYANPIIHHANVWSDRLPRGTSPTTYLVLAAACLVMRFARRLPGWLSLVIGLVAAVYGALAVVGEIPALAIYWPLALGGLVVSWILVATTRR